MMQVKERPFRASRIAALEGRGFDLKRSDPQTKCSSSETLLERSGPQHLFADVVVDLLRRGERVRFLAPGGSMYPTIRNNEVIGVEPVKASQVKRGDIILYRNDRGVIAHRVIKVVSYQRSAFSIEHSASSVEPSALSFERSSLSPHHSVLSIESSASSEAPNRLVQGEALLKAGGRSSNAVLLERSSPFFVLRGDASSTCDEPIRADQVLGKVVLVERDGRIIDLDNTKSKILQAASLYIYRIKRTLIKHIRNSGIMEYGGGAAKGLKERCT